MKVTGTGIGADPKTLDVGGKLVAIAWLTVEPGREYEFEGHLELDGEGDCVATLYPKLLSPLAPKPESIEEILVGWF